MEYLELEYGDPIEYDNLIATIKPQNYLWFQEFKVSYGDKLVQTVEIKNVRIHAVLPEDTKLNNLEVVEYYDLPGEFLESYSTVIYQIKPLSYTGQIRIVIDIEDESTGVIRHRVIPLNRVFMTMELQKVRVAEFKQSQIKDDPSSLLGFNSYGFGRAKN